MPSAVVLLSSGLDSAYNLFKALESYNVRLSLTFNYGQKAASREIACARALSEQVGVAHEVVELPWFKSFTKTALISSASVPSGKDVSIDDHAQSLETAKRVWVPNRNGIFLNVAAGFAEGLGASVVIPGFNAEEASTFPDNSGEFLQSLDASFAFSTATGVRTLCFSTGFTKTEIVADGVRLGLPFGKLWPCYESGTKWCGECESCQRFKRALKANGLAFEKVQASHEVKVP